MADFDALVLAGGAGRRLGGVDKAGIDVGDRTLLDRAFATVAAAHRIVVVGRRRTLPPGVLAACENPPGAGPVAAVEAGLAVVTRAVVVVLACDMPLVTGEHVRRLVDELASPDREQSDAVMYVDEGGWRQPLAAAYRVPALRRTLATLQPTTGVAVRRLIGPLTVAEIPADPGTTADCDTWADVARTRTLLEDR
jgi:molybdopterin-guanine dinucleotide biosynthesis protein A